jgi:hypothetical protein
MFVRKGDLCSVAGWQGGVRLLLPHRWDLIKLLRLVPTHTTLDQSRLGGLVVYVRQDLVTTFFSLLRTGRG